MMTKALSIICFLAAPLQISADGVCKDGESNACAGDGCQDHAQEDETTFLLQRSTKTMKAVSSEEADNKSFEDRYNQISKSQVATASAEKLDVDANDKELSNVGSPVQRLRDEEEDESRTLLLKSESTKMHKADALEDILSTANMTSCGGDLSNMNPGDVCYTVRYHDSHEEVIGVGGIGYHHQVEDGGGGEWCIRVERFHDQYHNDCNNAGLGMGGRGVSVINAARLCSNHETDSSSKMNVEGWGEQSKDFTNEERHQTCWVNHPTIHNVFTGHMAFSVDNPAGNHAHCCKYFNSHNYYSGKPNQGMTLQAIDNSNLCVNAEHDTNAHRNLQFYPCQAQFNDVFVFHGDKSIRPLANPDVCLNAANGLGMQHNIKLYPCAGRSPGSNEQWEFSGDKIRAVHNHDLCFNARDGLRAGAPLQLWHCWGGQRLRQTSYQEYKVRSYRVRWQIRDKNHWGGNCAQHPWCR